ncbi:MAG TPA: hypothetical protein VFU47_02540 [Armatimonadota bacterium]|nr:hypothetical protein [Armatimonadota bacterium]
MRKLKLTVEKLRVESFETDAALAAHSGTVAAHMPKPGGTGLCPTQITGSCCDVTLAQSCVQTNCFADCGVLTADPCIA